MPHPPASNDHRDPTPAELASILELLDGYTCEFNRDPERGIWDAQVDWKADPRNGPWTQICLLNYSGEDDEPHRFYFSKGRPAAVFAVVEGVARLCGPFVVFDDASGEPFVVTPGADVDELARRYNSLE